MSSAGQAWVTLATNDSYALGALVLAQSLRRNNTVHQLVVLITPGVSVAMRHALTSTFDLVKEVDVLDSKDAANLALLARPDLGITFTKLHCWNLTQFTKCVFLDADTLVVQNCDELFEREELSAAPDAGWPDCFNSGVFVYTPSEDTFKKLLDFALAHGSFDGGDQGLLNMFFNEWATKDIKKHLPFIYNMVASATYSYLPAFKVFGSNVKVAHFIGSNKPWLQSQQVPSTLSTYLELWWTIFKEDVVTKLDSNMMINCTVFQDRPPVTWSFSTPSPPPIPHNPPFLSSHSAQRHKFVDPWDYIQETQPDPTGNSTLNTDDVIDRLVQHLYESRNQNSQRIGNRSGISTSLGQHQSTSTKLTSPNMSHESIERSGREAAQTTYSNMLSNSRKKAKSQQLHQQHLQNHQNRDHRREQLYPLKEDVGNTPLEQAKPNNYIPMVISPPFSPALSVEYDNLQTKPEEPTPTLSQSGLAGAIAGGQRDIIEDQWRKQSWEQGNIDYLGADAFENIWKKMSATVGDAIKPLETPAPIGPEPTSSEGIDIVAPPTPGPAELPVTTAAPPTTESVLPSPAVEAEAPAVKAEAPAVEAEAPVVADPAPADAPPPQDNIDATPPVAAADVIDTPPAEAAPLPPSPAVETAASPVLPTESPVVPVKAEDTTGSQLPSEEPTKAEPAKQEGTGVAPKSEPPQSETQSAQPGEASQGSVEPTEQRTECSNVTDPTGPAAPPKTPSDSSALSEVTASEKSSSTVGTTESTTKLTEIPATPTEAPTPAVQDVLASSLQAEAIQTHVPQESEPQTKQSSPPKADTIELKGNDVAKVEAVTVVAETAGPAAAPSSPTESTPLASPAPASEPTPAPTDPLSSPASPSVPSPSSPAAPEGTTTLSASQPPSSPTTDIAPGSSADALVQTPTGEAPVPPKRRSTKAKGKK